MLFRDHRSDAVESLPPSEVAPLPPRQGGGDDDRRDDHHGLAGDPRGGNPIERNLDRVLSVQRPLVVAHVRLLRAAYPSATPAELLRKIDLQFLNTVTVTGGGAGAVAAVPGIGTVASIGVTGVETLSFFELSALYGQAVAEIHGLHISDPERARALVMSLMLGDTGRKLVGQFAKTATGRGSREQFWGEVITGGLPGNMFEQLTKRIRKAFMKRILTRIGASGIGKLVPFGVGAVLGGVGNRKLAQTIVESAREAFGPPPAAFPLELSPMGSRPGEPREQSTSLFHRSK